MSKHSRRDFLKAAGLLPASMAWNKFLPVQRNNSDPNIIILVLDALSATNMSLYGYVRDTTPNINKLAERSFVYHSHRSAGTFTTPGTSSLLTGMYPWKHRALSLGGVMLRDVVENNIFRIAQGKRYTAAFTQNRLANYILSQCEAWLDYHIPIGTFSETENSTNSFGQKDLLLRQRAFNQFLFGGTHPPASLFFGGLKYYKDLAASQAFYNQNSDPRGNYVDEEIYFIIEKVFDNLISYIYGFDSPFLAYIHLLPPHENYAPGPEFSDKFMDDWHPRRKPFHPLLSNWEKYPVLDSVRRQYDQYLARTDAAFGKFLGQLDTMGLLENSYFILTSDHGEMFERGVRGHLSPLVYDPGIRVPLVIHTPGQTERVDVHSSTNSIDMVPTIATLLGAGIPEWCEGRPLPGMGGQDNSERTTYTMVKKSGSSVREKLSPITITAQRGDYKLIYYTGYTDYKKAQEDKSYFTGAVELYDTSNDPDELVNLSESHSKIADEMLGELLTRYEKDGGALK